MLRPPTISVVVPAYNHERYVGEAIDSVLGQTWQDFELVVVDDGSSDATAEIVARRAEGDPRIRLLRQANRGSHAAINRGVAESSAPWIAILNSDDRYAPHRLERLVEHCAGGFDFAVTGARLIDADGAPIEDPAHWWHAKVGGFVARAREAGPLAGLLYGNFTVSTSNFFLRRALFDAIGPMRHLRYIVDWEYALRAALHAPQRFAFLADEPLLDYRLHGGNAILGGTLRGAAEIAHVFHGLLPRLGTPPEAVTALYRAQRDLRRGWRDRHMQVAEGFVRAREADVARHREEARQAHAQALSAQDENARLRALLEDRERKLDRFRNSIPGRAYALLRRLGGR